MSPITLALIVFMCVFGSALFGMFLRPLLPEHHLSADSKEVTRIVTGLMATLAALVLGLLVASAKTSFDTFNNVFRQNAAKVIVLDRVLAQYGQETKELRDLIRNAYATRIEELFPRDKSERVSLDAAQETARVEGIQQRLRALTPRNDAQRALQSRALEISGEVVQARWLGVEEEANTVPTPFLVVLVFWLAAMFTSFGLFAPRNATAIAVLFLGALSLAASIFLIEELNDPLHGFIAISSAPMYKALAFLGQ